MLNQQLSRIVPGASIERPGQGRTDRSMDVLQYGMAALAIVGAVLLATFR